MISMAVRYNNAINQTACYSILLKKQSRKRRWIHHYTTTIDPYYHTSRRSLRIKSMRSSEHRKSEIRRNKLIGIDIIRCVEFKVTYISCSYLIFIPDSHWNFWPPSQIIHIFFRCFRFYLRRRFWRKVSDRTTREFITSNFILWFQVYCIIYFFVKISVLIDMNFILFFSNNIYLSSFLCYSSSLGLLIIEYKTQKHIHSEGFIGILGILRKYRSFFMKVRISILRKIRSKIITQLIVF